MIEFKTTLDINAQKALNKFMMKKLFIFFMIMSVVLIAIGIVGVVATNTKDEADISSGITLIIVGLIFPPIICLINKIAQKNASKTPFLTGETKEIYRFYDDKIEHLQKKGETFYSQMQADYSYIFKAYSTPTHFFLYISANQCHVIPKDRITKGTCEELDDILARKLSAGKFKKKSK